MADHSTTTSRLTRRGFLGQAAGAATAVALVSSCAGAAETADPMLELARHWREQDAIFDAGFGNDDATNDALAARTIDPVLDGMLEGVPTPTTEAGAIEALRLATGNGPPRYDPMISHNLTAAVLAYLQGRA